MWWNKVNFDDNCEKFMAMKCKIFYYENLRVSRWLSQKCTGIISPIYHFFVSFYYSRATSYRTFIDTQVSLELLREKM